MNMPIDIYNLICEFLDIYTLSKLPYLIHKFRIKVLEKRNYVIDNFPEEIISMFSFEKMINFPILKFQDRFIGFTDYIDRIKAEDLSEPIMIGIDCYKRAFICIRTMKLKKNNNITVDTIFQRYTNDKSYWTHGGYGFIKNSSIDSITKNNIKNLLNNNKNLIYPSFTYEDEDSKFYIQETILV
jgi:hypothetical protein